MEKCELCEAESKYEYSGKNLCSDCVTKVAKQIVPNYFSSEHDGADHKLIVNGDIISVLTSHA